MSTDLGPQSTFTVTMWSFKNFVLKGRWPKECSNIYSRWGGGVANPWCFNPKEYFWIQFPPVGPMVEKICTDNINKFSIPFSSILIQ